MCDCCMRRSTLPPTSSLSSFNRSSASCDCGAIQQGYIVQSSSMDNKRGAALFSQHNVPLDIWSEILPMLPVKSLVRFRCVSKSWQLLIDDPDFRRPHLTRFKNNSNETHLLFVEGWVDNCVIRCSETFNTTEKLGSLGRWDTRSKTYRSTATPGYDGSWNTHNTVDGLFLLTTITQRYELMLWNPSIRKCRLLPMLPGISTVDRKTKCVDLGLGFDPSIKDYKVVRAVLREEFVSSIAIYTVGTGSWKTIQFQRRGRSKGRGLSNGSWCDGAHESVYLQGFLYFVSDIKVLVIYDMTSEVFTFAKLPAFHVDPLLPANVHDSLAFVDGGCSLAVFRFSPYRGTIWALENSKINPTSLCWTKRCSFTRSIPCFFYLKKNGDLLLRSRTGRELKSYNIQTRAKRLVPKTSRSEVTKVFGYKESLFLLR